MNQPNNQSHYISARVLKINVGFILAEGPGYSRDVHLDIPERVQVAEDLFVERLSGLLRLTRTSEGVLLQGTINTVRLAQCTRCLEDVAVTLDFEIEELYATKLGTSTQFMIGENAILELAPLLREEIMINTPGQIYCREDCQGLCPTCGKNLNYGPCDCKPEDIDPRWSALMNLQKKLTDGDDKKRN